MKYSRVNLGSLLGVTPRARRKRKMDPGIDHYFENPIIHRQIHGDEVYVPLKQELFGR
jgi:hypothetical protein